MDFIVWQLTMQNILAIIAIRVVTILAKVSFPTIIAKVLITSVAEACIPKPYDHIESTFATGAIPAVVASIANNDIVGHVLALRTNEDILLNTRLLILHPPYTLSTPSTTAYIKHLE
jgi:hypothetical protein